LTPILLALLAAGTPANTLRACSQQAASDPVAATMAADAWARQGGGADARLCQGLALSGLQRWAAAAAAFEQAASEAEAKNDRRATDFRVQAGNAWVAAGEPGRATAAFDAALAATTLTPQFRGEIHLDRARAAVAASNEAGARVDIDKALTLVPQDPFAWYLSAALARRQNDLKRAREEIAKAASLAPDEASILVEAGNIAGLSDDPDAARTLFERAIRLQPNSEAARAARAALAANAAPPAAPVADTRR
jgi:tetratricopeptide (TPR) repeat protein